MMKILYTLLMAALVAKAEAAQANLIPRVEAVGHTGVIGGIAYTPDGKYIVTASDDKTVRVWERATGRLVRVIRGQIGPGPEGKLYALAVSPDGELIAVGGYGITGGPHSVFIYSLSDGRLLKRLTGHSNVIYALAFSPDGRYLASGGHDHTIIIWDTKTWKKVRRLRGHTREVYGLAFFPNSRLLASASLDSTLRIWDVETGRTVHILRGHDAEVYCVAVSKDGVVASGSDDHTIKLWKDGKLLRTLHATDEIDALAFTPDGKRLIVATYNDDNITLWDVRKGEVVKVLGSHSNTVLAVAVSPDGTEAVSAGGNQYEIIRWNLKTFQKISEWKSKGKQVNRVGFSKDGNAIGFGYKWKGPVKYAFHFDGLNMTDADDDDFIKERTSGDGIELVIKRHPDYPYDRLFARVNGEERPIAVHDLQYWDEVRAATLTPDNRYVAVATNFGLFLYDLNGRFIREFVGHYGEVWSVAVSPEGQLLVSGGADQTVRLWNIETGELLLTIFYSVEDSEWVAMTPAGYYASSPHGDRYIGWHENRGLDREARFYRLSQFYREFYNPEFVSKVIEYRSVDKALEWLEREGHRRPMTYEDIASRRPPEVRIIEPWDGSRSTIGRINLVAEVKYPQDAPPSRIRILLNGYGYYSTKSIAVESGGSADDEGMVSMRFERQIELDEGRNLIEIIAENKYGQSDKVGVVVYFESQKQREWQKPDLYVLAIGVSKFKNPSYNLEFPDDDARAIAQKFKSQEGKLFRHVYTRVLVDEDATREAILDGLDWLDQNATQHDLVVVSVSTHGVRGPRGELYVMPYDGERDRLRATAIKFLDFNDVLANIPGKVILLLDLCHAGAAEWIAMRDVDINAVLKDFSEAGSAVSVFAASTESEYAAEYPELGHGVFTKAVLDALSSRGDLDGDGAVYINEFNLYITRRVRELCKRFHCLQHVESTMPEGLVDYPIFWVR